MKAPINTAAAMMATVSTSALARPTVAKPTAAMMGSPILVKVENTHDVITDAVVSLASNPHPEYIANRATRSAGPGNTVAAAEWAEALGADVITSSLGYFTFDAPFGGYDVQDLDGQTIEVSAKIRFAQDDRSERTSVSGKVVAGRREADE